MRRWIVPATLGLLLAAVAAAVAAPAGSSTAGDLVVVGGKGSDVREYSPYPPVRIDLKIVAVRSPSGVVSGRVDHQSAKHDPYYGFLRTVGDVTCVRPSAIVPGRVAIGGVYTRTDAGPFFGWKFLWIVDDRSSSGAGLDLYGLGGSDPSGNADTCPFDPGLVDASQLDALDEGDFVIRTS